ncbi:hypothetical protein DV515_00016000 [Chloebia gouldiae]|uniref:dUTPase-like domain-containing protein n=1 Tax=Chloebia gouldiae TaxID=44316 RepID=A0A3L8RV66_CHLGU|nr:hypothetical protein DV515_00016000 [Chloebia gouldiae]
MVAQQIMVALAAIVVEEWGIFVETAKLPEYGARNANLTPTIPFGKLQDKRERQRPRSNTNRRCNQLTCLQPEISGSLGLDLAASAEVTLLTSQPEGIPTGINGPVIVQGHPVGTLLLGRSSASMLGLLVFPGVIDADFKGEIMIMVHTPFPPLCIMKGQKIAQLVPLEQMTKTLGKGVSLCFYPYRSTLGENETGCIYLGNYRWEVNDSTTWLTPKHPDFADATQHCGYDKTYGWDSNHTRVWANSSAMALPENTFLICGDCAWHGMPWCAHGGPCYLGKLTLLAPNMTMVALLKKNLDRDRAKRDISQLNPDCDDNVELWAPGVAAAHSLTTLGKLACWTVKQANITTAVIEQLVQDVDAL